MTFRVKAIKVKVKWELSSRLTQFDFNFNAFSLTFFEALGFFQTMHLVFPYFIYSISYYICHKASRTSMHKFKKIFQ